MKSERTYAKRCANRYAKEVKQWGLMQNFFFFFLKCSAVPNTTNYIKGCGRSTPYFCLALTEISMKESKQERSD